MKCPDCGGEVGIYKKRKLYGNKSKRYCKCKECGRKFNTLLERVETEKFLKYIT